MIKKSATFFLLASAVAVITAWSAGGVFVVARVAAKVRPDLTGQWQLNRDLSDDSQEKLQNMGGGGGGADGGGHGPGHRGGSGGSGGGADGGGHGPGHRGGSGGGGGGEQAAHAQLGEMILSAPTRFVLTQDDQKVVLTEPDGRVRTLPTNNRKVKVDGRDVQTKWEKNRLVSEITVGDAKVIETYERSPNASQLIVTARVDMRGRQVSVRRVYDAAPK